MGRRKWGLTLLAAARQRSVSSSSPSPPVPATTAATAASHSVPSTASRISPTGLWLKGSRDPRLGRVCPGVEGG